MKTLKSLAHEQCLIFWTCLKLKEIQLIQFINQQKKAKNV